MSIGEWIEEDSFRCKLRSEGYTGSGNVSPIWICYGRFMEI